MKTVNDPVTDKMGYPIPDGCLKLWKDSVAVKDMALSIFKVRVDIATGHSVDDPVYRMIPVSVVDVLTRVQQQLKEAEPYAVCLYCSGQDATKPHCSICRGTGLISKFSYQFKTDKKLQLMREAQLKGKTR